MQDLLRLSRRRSVTALGSAVALWVALLAVSPLPASAQHRDPAAGRRTRGEMGTTPAPPGVSAGRPCYQGRIDEPGAVRRGLEGCRDLAAVPDWEPQRVGCLRVEKRNGVDGIRNSCLDRLEAYWCRVGQLCIERVDMGWSIAPDAWISSSGPVTHVWGCTEGRLYVPARSRCE